MAVPKRRTSVTKRDKRRAHDALEAPHVIACPSAASRRSATGPARIAARTAAAKWSRSRKARARVTVAPPGAA